MHTKDALCIVLIAIGATLVSTQRHPDYEQFLHFYEALDGPNWINNTNWKNESNAYV